jgi:hypothetical protein
MKGIVYLVPNSSNFDELVNSFCVVCCFNSVGLSARTILTFSSGFARIIRSQINPIFKECGKGKSNKVGVLFSFF